MVRIAVWKMELEKRERYTLTVGPKQDPTRALFTGLLPPGETCYTAAEVVKFSLPAEADRQLRLQHFKALASLARLHGLGDNKDPGPDNVDKNGNRLPGKKPGRLQPCRWNRQSWLNIINDETYEWLLAFNQKLKTLTATNPPGSVFYCELETFEITVEPPAQTVSANAPPEKISPAKDPENAKSQILPFWKQRSFRYLASIVGIFISIFILLPLNNNQEMDSGEDARTLNKWELTPEELALDYDSYVKALIKQPTIEPGPPPPNLGRWSATWEIATPNNEMMACNPPPMFLVGEPGN